MQTAFWGPARITAIINNSNNSKHLSLVFWVSFCLEMLVRWRVLRRCASTNRRRYAQQPLHRAAFMRTCSYCTQRGLCTEKLLHTDAFTHRGFHAKKLLDAEAFTQRRFIQSSKMLLHSAAFTHRRVSTQTPFHTDAFAHRRFHTRKLLHKETFAHNSFYAQMFSSPPPQKNRQTCIRACYFFSFPVTSLPDNER